MDSATFSRAILDSVQAEIAVLDCHAVIVAVNASWRKVSQEYASTVGPGQTPYSCIGVNYLDICNAALGDPDAFGVADIGAGIRAVLDGNKPRFVFEYACHSANAQRWFQTAVTPLQGPGTGAVVSHTNITEMVQANRARFETEERFAQFMQALPASAHIKDSAGYYLYANPHAQGLMRGADWRGKRAADLFASGVAAHCEASDTQAMEGGATVAEEAIPDRQGQVAIYQAHKFKIVRAGQSDLLGCVSLDITELKNTQVALTRAKAQAESANHAKSRLLAFISHDVRQPLSALSLFIHVLKGRAQPQNHALVAQIDACCASLSGLLTDVLDVSKLELELVNPQRTRFGAGAFLQELATIYRSSASAKNLYLRVRLNGWGTLAAHTDRGLLTRIVGNLMANAMEHTRSGGVLLALRCRFGRHWIEVWDSGAGMQAQQAELIAQELSPSSVERSVRDSGLGLSIVAKSAALLGLQLRMRSCLGCGSVFAVEVPLVRCQDEETLPAAPLAARALRIALVDDHDSARLALAFALEALGHAVHAAGSGHNLLLQLGDQAPDLIIADCGLHTKGNGLEAIDRVRAAFGAQLPAVVVSGNTDPVFARHLAQQGVALCLKPLKIPDLQAALRTATDQSVASLVA
ncbi:MAG: PAS domain-containing protein [Betaproteobacteria bacterium]